MMIDASAFLLLVHVCEYTCIVNVMIKIVVVIMTLWEMGHV